MNFSIRLIGLLFILTLATETLIAQNQPAKRKSTIKSDTSAKAPAESTDEMSLPITFDTTLVPQDALTTAIWELVKESGEESFSAELKKNINEVREADAEGKLPPEFYDRLLAEFEKGEIHKWIMNTIVRIYREKFTLEEVNEVLRFYRTPVGKKLVKAVPEITEIAGVEGGKIGEYVGMKIYFQLVKEGKIKE